MRSSVDGWLYRPDDQPFHYANLAVRSRRVRDLRNEQLTRTSMLRPDLVSILIGANDLVGHRAAPVALAAEVEQVVRRLRDEGADVPLVTPFRPRRRIARESGALLLDLEALPAIGDLGMWADDRVHLGSRGHRFLAYRAADVLGVPDAETLEGLDAALHDDAPASGGTWLRRDVLPCVWRRLRGRTAGDGVSPKHDDYVIVGRGDTRARAAG